MVALLACVVAAWAVMALPAESKKKNKTPTTISFEWGPANIQFLGENGEFGDSRVVASCPSETVAISGRHFYALDGKHHFGDEHPFFTRASGVTEGGYYAEVGRAGSTENTDPGLQVVVQAFCARR
jgi:hypothetical protein